MSKPLMRPRLSEPFDKSSLVLAMRTQLCTQHLRINPSSAAQTSLNGPALTSQLTSAKFYKWV